MLYNPEGHWRYAIYNLDGVVDGGLPDTDSRTPPEDAQVRLVAQVEEWTGKKYDAMWTSDKPNWWRADLTVVG